MGSGFRTFTAGEVLTASNVQNYLMDQSVMVFAGTAARSSAIGTANFEEGMVTYLTDVDQLQAYNGTSWAQVGQTPGLVLLNTTSFSAVSSQSINDVFSATYLHYVLVLSAISTNDTDIKMRWRVSGSDNTTSNYSWGQAGTFASTGTFSGGASNNDSQFRLTSSNAANSQKFGTYTLYNPFATDTSGFTGHLSYSSGTANYFAGSIGGGFNGTTSFTGFSIYPTAGTITGSLSVYGVNK